MRFLFILSEPVYEKIGGLEYLNKELIHFLVYNKKHTVNTITLSELPPKQWLKKISLCSTMIKNRIDSFDIVIFNQMHFYSFFDKNFTIEEKKKIIVWEHGSFLQKHMIKQNLIRIKCKDVLIISCAKHLTKSINMSNVITINNFISRFIHGEKIQHSDKTHFGLYCTQRKVKRTQDIIDVLNSINSKRILVVTCGYAEKFKIQCDYLDLGKLETFNGLNVFYSSIDCLLNFSKTEGNPLMMIERKQYKLPVICSNIPGNKEIVEKYDMLCNNKRELKIKILHFHNTNLKKYLKIEKSNNIRFVDDFYKEFINSIYAFFTM